MTYEIYEKFLNELASAYTEYNANYILPWLSDNFTYSSFWVSAHDLIKEEYTKYIIEKLATMKKTNTKNPFFMMYQQETDKPFLLCGIKTPQGGFGCFDTKINDDGKVESLAIMPSSFYHLGYKDKEKFDEFMASL